MDSDGESKTVEHKHQTRPERAPNVDRAPASDRPDYSRLTRSDVATIAKLARDGYTQADIATRIGCSQSTVNKWINALQDTSDVAKEFLRGAALSMAKNIVRKGRPRDHVATLQGIDVLRPQVSQSLVVIVGGRDDIQVSESLPIAKQISSRSTE